jgi:hypothetical protein
MELWLQSNGEILFKVSTGYARVFSSLLVHLYINKRSKIKEIDIITFAHALSKEYPQNFIAMYYSEDIRYWHELRELIKCVCA